MSDEFLTALDDASRAELSEGPRNHLGASQVGAKCAREPWYAFRHALNTNATTEGRMMELWKHGHREEAQFHRKLTNVGAEVRPWAERLVYHGGSDSFANIPWEEDFPMDCDDVSLDPMMVQLAIRMRQGPLQWQFEDHDGHYAGSTDGTVRGVSTWFPETAAKGWGLLECKTHGDQSFNELVKKAVQTAKPVHYIQMQEYMHYRDLAWALYMAINKNTHRLYAEVIMRRPEVGNAYSSRAHQIIQARLAPPRISEDPSSFLCRMCDFKRICHYGEPVDKNCRSCQYASPGPDKSWVCGLYNNTIPVDFIPKGCAKYEGIK